MSTRSGDSTIGGKRARDDSFRAGGVLLKFDKDEDEESPAEVSESNLVTNAARARRSSSSCCRAYNKYQYRLLENLSRWKRALY